MQIPPHFSVTAEILSFISKIEVLRLHFASFDLAPNLKEKIRRVSLLKSSLFSARIEGNPLELADLNSKDADRLKKMEIFNIMEAINLIETKVKKGSLSRNLLLDLHAHTLKNISPDAGHFRKEASAIFNQAGVAVYMPPSPSKVLQLLNKLLIYINSDKEKFPLITAFIAHLVFEKIHPFLDGNGRVGRLLIAAVLKSKGWDFTFTVPFEEYLDNNKDEYYYHLDKGLQSTNEYLIFMLNAFLNQTDQIKAQIEQELAKRKEPFLPPRQEEIYNIIKDHAVVSFDMIKRRFYNIPDRTLRYDLKKLTDNGFIEKSGETKGRYYRVKK